MVEEEDHVWHDGSYHKPVDVEEAENAAKEVTPGISRIHLTRREMHHLARPLCDTASIRLRLPAGTHLLGLCSWRCSAKRPIPPT